MPRLIDHARARHRHTATLPLADRLPLPWYRAGDTGRAPAGSGAATEFRAR